MWVRVEHIDETKRLPYGVLDNEHLNSHLPS